MSEQETKTAKPRRRGWLRIALFVSLIFNLLFVGMIVGAAAGKRRFDDRSGAPDDRTLSQLGPYGRALPKESREALAQSLRPAPKDAVKMRRDLRKGFHDVLSVLRTEPFDPAAYSRLVKTQQSIVAERVSDGQNALLDQLIAMSPEQRQEFANRLERVLRRGPGRSSKP